MRRSRIELYVFLSDKHVERDDEGVLNEHVEQHAPMFRPLSCRPRIDLGLEYSVSK